MTQADVALAGTKAEEAVTYDTYVFPGTNLVIRNRSAKRNGRPGREDKHQDTGGLQLPQSKIQRDNLLLLASIGEVSSVLFPIVLQAFEQITAQESSPS